MGGKQSKEATGSGISLNPNERRRLTAFLERRGSNNQFNRQDMLRLWKDLLVPDLLNKYVDFLMKQDVSKKNYIGIDEFAFIYSSIIRGDAEERVSVLASIIGYRKGASGNVISYNEICKYLSDLLESYFLGLKEQNDVNYKSWTLVKQPDRRIIEQIARGICSDLTRKNDDVQLNDMEIWLNYTGLIAVLHSYVLGFLYNLEPEIKACVVPQAILPTTKTAPFLDISQTIYINSFVPSDNKLQWRFLFSTSTHGESFSKLVGCITNQGPIILVIEADDKSTFGGFISENVAPGPKWVGSEDSFLFRLTPSVEVYPSTGYNDHYAYLNMHQTSLPNGLGMGGQFNYWGLWIDSHFGNGECSESCTTYKNYKMLAPRKKFHINKIEIWGVGDRPLTAEERGERSKGGPGELSILDKETSTSHLLEMAGHKSHSKGIRDMKKE